MESTYFSALDQRGAQRRGRGHRMQYRRRCHLPVAAAACSSDVGGVPSERRVAVVVEVHEHGSYDSTTTSPCPPGRSAACTCGDYLRAFGLLPMRMFPLSPQVSRFPCQCAFGAVVCTSAFCQWLQPQKYGITKGSFGMQYSS